MYALDTSHDGKNDFNFIFYLNCIDAPPPLICKQCFFAVANEETTAGKGMDAGEGVDTSILTYDIMARIKVPFLLRIFWSFFPIVKYFVNSNIIFFVFRHIWLMNPLMVCFPFLMLYIFIKNEPYNGFSPFPLFLHINEKSSILFSCYPYIKSSFYIVILIQYFSFSRYVVQA